MEKLKVLDYEINTKFVNNNDYVSLTDLAKYKNKQDSFLIINQWMRNKGTIEFLGLWEKMNNPNFKPTEFDRFKNDSGGNTFMLPPQRWINKTIWGELYKCCRTCMFSKFRKPKLSIYKRRYNSKR